MQAADESWDDLKHDLEQLNTVIHEFADHVNVCILLMLINDGHESLKMFEQPIRHAKLNWFYGANHPN